jgi:hypothetical protein
MMQAGSWGIVGAMIPDRLDGYYAEVCEVQVHQTWP